VLPPSKTHFFALLAAILVLGGCGRVLNTTRQLGVYRLAPATRARSHRAIVQRATTAATPADSGGDPRLRAFETETDKGGLVVWT
jgi:hypothetical protein